MRDNRSATILSSPGCSMNEHMLSPGLPSPPPMTIAGLEPRNNFETCFGSRETLESHVICMWGTWFAMSGDEERGAHSRNFGEFARDSLETILPFPCQSVVIFLQIEFKRLDHPDNFFFADFLAAAQRVFMRAVVEECISDQVLAPDQQCPRIAARALPCRR